MKILILDGIFNPNFVIGPRMSFKLQEYLNKYKRLKLQKFVNKLVKNTKEKLEIKIISNQPGKPIFAQNVLFETISDYRINLERELFLNIHNRIKKSTKKNLKLLLNNLKKLNFFSINGIFIGELIELNIIWFFNNIIGEIELIKIIINQEDYDRIIFINFNHVFDDYLTFFNRKNRNIEICKDSILKSVYKMPFWAKTLFFLKLLGISLINFQKKIKNKRLFFVDKKKFLLFVSNTENQFKSIENIYDFYKQSNKTIPIIYKNINTIPLNKISKLITFILVMKKCWIKNLDVISKNLSHESFNFDNILKEFYNRFLYFIEFNIFNNYHNFNLFCKKYHPSIVFISNEMKFEGRLYAKYCKNKQIPTIYIPHAAFPVYDEIITKRDFGYITVPGDRDKEYLLKTGVKENKIIITGRPRYEKFYRGQKKKLTEIKDINGKDIYKFKPNKFTILFTTSPIDYKSREKQLLTVLDSIKKLNLIDNLIIKLHPSENEKWYETKLNELNLNPTIVKECNILELINSSDLLLSRVSTTILEAMLVGTPSILLNLTNARFHISGTYLFSKDDFLIKIKNQEELTTILKKIYYNSDFYKKYKENLKLITKKYIFYNENQSSFDIIIGIINKLLRINSNLHSI